MKANKGVHMKATVTAMANQNGTKDIFFTASFDSNSELKEFSKKHSMKIVSEFMCVSYIDLRGSIKKGAINENGLQKARSLFNTGIFSYNKENNNSATEEEFKKAIA